MSNVKVFEMFLKEHGFLASNKYFASLDDILIALRDDCKSNYVEFDTECICNPDDYGDLLKAFQSACGGYDLFEILHADIDLLRQKASVWIRVNGNDIKGEWNQLNDWVTEEFFGVVNHFKKVLKGRFVELCLDQCYRAFYFSDPKAAEEMQTLADDLSGNGQQTPSQERAKQ